MIGRERSHADVGSGEDLRHAIVSDSPDKLDEMVDTGGDGILLGHLPARSAPDAGDVDRDATGIAVCNRRDEVLRPMPGAKATHVHAPQRPRPGNLGARPKASHVHTVDHHGDPISQFHGHQMPRRRVDRRAPGELEAAPAIDRPHDGQLVEKIAQRSGVVASRGVDFENRRHAERVSGGDRRAAESIETLNDDIGADFADELAHGGRRRPFEQRRAAAEVVQGDAVGQCCVHGARRDRRHGGDMDFVPAAGERAAQLERMNTATVGAGNRRPGCGVENLHCGAPMNCGILTRLCNHGAMKHGPDDGFKLSRRELALGGIALLPGAGIAARRRGATMETQGERITLSSVAGLKVGHKTRADRPTGCTVVVAEEGAVAGVSVRGAAPGTRETAVLEPENTVEKVHAVALTGGSAFGLTVADGVMRVLRDRGIGYAAGTEIVPIVPAAVIFDLGLGGNSHPSAEDGAEACNAATAAAPEEGSVGAGARGHGRQTDG